MDTMGDMKMINHTIIQKLYTDLLSDRFISLKSYWSNIPGNLHRYLIS